MLTIARIRTFCPRLKRPSRRMTAVSLLVATLGFGGCAQSPQQLAASSQHGKEYFPSSVYGRASRRVIADGQPIPHGGGQYLVGKPYTVAGQTYVPSERHIVQVGLASWYGDAFHGRLTANGEIYDRDSFSAAHPTMPLPSYARVTNLSNHYSMIVRVNDRGPYASNRIMDVSRKVAEALDFKRTGTAKVKVEYVGAASLAGSDDAKLYATLRQDGPARWQGEAPTMVAERTPAAAPRVQVASLAPYVPERIERSERVERMNVEPMEKVDRHERRHEPVEEARGEPARLSHRDALARDAAILARASTGDRRRDMAEPETSERRDLAARQRHDGNDRVTRTIISELRHAPLPPMRLARGGREERAVLPPSRPLDLGTIPGAASQIGRHHGPGLRMARARDD